MSCARDEASAVFMYHADQIIGVTHNGVICDECNKSNIKGSRWKCSRTNVNVGARQGKLPKAAYGFWEDAVVKRGPDWEWGSQDGGNGKTGKIKKLYNWKCSQLDGEGNGATVQWDESRVCTNYRIGANGKVDVIAVRPTAIGPYYKQHLPIIDKDLLHSTDEDSYSFNEGDTVAINVNWDEMKRLQVGHGGVNDDMEESVGRIGTVMSVMPTGDIAVKIVYKISGILALLAGSSDVVKSSISVYNPRCLCKVESFSSGDKVRVHSNKDVIIKMQEGRGGWNDAMSDSLGKVGDVLSVDDDGDVKVNVNGHQWTFSPAALKKLPSPTAGSLQDRNLLPGTDEDSHNFSEGDAVAINVNWDEMKRLQVGHGDVNDDMKGCIGQIGKVMRVTPNGDIVESFSTGDKVKVRSNKDVIIKMQEGRGGWNDAMSDSLGKVGDVLSVDDDGDVKVKVNGHQLTFSPAALKKLPSSTADSLQGDIRDALLEGLRKLLVGSLEDGNLMIAATKNGDKDTVESILKKDRQAANVKNGETSPLQIACHKGYLEIAEILLRYGADIYHLDNDGDTALHYAAIGSSLELVKLLIRNKAALDLQNKKGLTALHIAVWKGGVEIVRTLADSNADVNTQDKEGDTPLHDAIFQDRTDIVDILLRLPSIYICHYNKKGFNPLHLAAVKGKDDAVKLMLDKAPEFVNIQKEDGFSPLHVAIVNGHEDIVYFMLNEGNCQLELKTCKGHTAIMLAAMEGYIGIMKLLISHGANVMSEDNDGDTLLHTVLMRFQAMSLVAEQLTGIESVPDIAEILSQIDRPKASPLAIACYLVKEGADLHHCNHAGKSSLDIVTEPAIKNILGKFKEKRMSIISSPTSTSPPRSNMPSGTALDTVQGAASSPGPGAVTNADVCQDCKEFLIDAEFKPCGHKLCCQSCADNFKKCKECKREITSVSAFLPSSMPICKLCEENKANIRMLPCNHVIVCHGPAPEDDVDADSSNCAKFVLKIHALWHFLVVTVAAMFVQLSCRNVTSAVNQSPKKLLYMTTELF
eukprot:gene16588-18276_t